MKLPRFSLRTLFVLIALLSIPLGWAAYQLQWIRQRNQFANQYRGGRWSSIDEFPELPFGLQLFGALYEHSMLVPQSLALRAHDLFPEAMIFTYPDGHPPE